MRLGTQPLIWTAAALTIAAASSTVFSQENPPEPAKPDQVTNDYYRDPEAKKVIDAIIEAHGGRERIEAVDRVKITMHTRMYAGEADITIYQTRSAIRRDTTIEDRVYVECLNADGIWVSESNEDQASPAGLDVLLQFEIDKGLLQQPMLNKLLAKDRELTFRGKTIYREKSCWLIETKDVMGQTVKHYFDAETNLALAEVTVLGDDRESRQLFVLHDRFEGVGYAKRVALTDEKNQLQGSTEITEITSDFPDSVFKKPGK